MSERIFVHQALFGYRDGHNSLVTSVPLPPRAKQFLATITDSSGPDAPKGFDRAFTGLPLPETEFYAFFCTWPAPEMPRPGCVWSHVLLIHVADLARIRDFRQLRDTCIRPSVPVDLGNYDGRRTLEFLPQRRGSDNVPSRGHTHCLLQSLYEHPDDGIVILDDTNREWEDAVFVVWAQQWPRLRRSFAFSTGSLGDRRLAGIGFDLQIAPLNSERLWKRIGARTRLIHYEESVTGVTGPKWLCTAENDLCEQADPQFRQFLIEYGSDIERPRAAFANLALAYQTVNATQDWADTLALVADLFPSPSDALRLKRTLLTVPESLQGSEMIERAWSVAAFLTESPLSTAYPTTGVDFARLAGLLWNERRQQTRALLGRLLQQEEKQTALAFATGVASVIDAGSLRMLADSHSALLPLAIKHQPFLAYEVDTWSLSPYTQTHIYEALCSLNLSEAGWGPVLGAMLIAGTHVSVRDAVSKAGRFAMRGAFLWLAHDVSKRRLPSDQWRDALSGVAAAMLAEMDDLQPDQLALSAWCLSSGDVHRVLNARRADVRRLAEGSPDAVPDPLRLSTSFLLLTLGLKESSPAGVTLVMRNFFPVHEALATGEHSSESLWLLSPQLPSLGWWRDWDRCKKLRRAVRSYLAAYGGHRLLFASARTPSEHRLAHKIAKDDRDDSGEQILD